MNSDFSAINKSTLNRFCLGLATAVSVCLLYRLFAGGGSWGNFGNVDFVGYWSAFKLIRQGDNPYDPRVLLAMQQALGRNLSLPLMVWSPPWLLLILFPILALPISAAAYVWGCCNLLFTITSAALIWNHFSGKREQAGLCLLAAITFFPLCYSMLSGQIGCLLLFGVTLVLIGMQKKPVIAGIGVFLMTLKPHLFSAVFVLILFHALRTRKLIPLLIGMLLLAAALSLLQLWAPGMSQQWFEALNTPDPSGYLSPYAWKVPTLVGLLRMSFHSLEQPSSNLLLYLPAALAAGIFTLYLFRSYRAENWSTVFPAALLISYLTSPYGWTADQSVLCVTMLAALINGAQKLRFLTVVSLLNLGAAIASIAFGQEQINVFYPLSLGLLSYFGNRSCSEQPSDG